MNCISAWAIAALLVLGAPARAEEYSAIVEAASPGVPVQVFGYLSRGHVIDLGREMEIVLGYLHSCVQERLRGGVVTIGRERSEVRGGQRSSIELDCGASAELSQAEAELGAVGVVRASMVDEGRHTTLISVSPLIAPRRPASWVRVTRLDRSEPIMTLESHGGVVDLAALGKSLSRGGSYRVETESESIVAHVDRDARSGGAYILPRLLSF